MKGQGDFDPEKKLFCLSNLDINYPGIYKTNSVMCALAQKEAYDLRPEIIKESTPNMFKKCINDNAEDKSKFGTKKQSWWHYVRINDRSCISSIKFMRNQLKTRPYWHLAILLLISVVSTLLIHLTLHITLLSLLASKALAFALSATASIMISYCIFVFINCAQALETLPDEETSTFGTTYAGAAEFRPGKKTDNAHQQGSNPDENDALEMPESQIVITDLFVHPV